MTEIERVRAKIEEIISRPIGFDEYNPSLHKANQILKIKGIAILADDQNHPSFVTLRGITGMQLVKACREVDDRAGFRKIVGGKE